MKWLYRIGAVLRRLMMRPWPWRSVAIILLGTACGQGLWSLWIWCGAGYASSIDVRSTSVLNIKFAQPQMRTQSPIAGADWRNRASVRGIVVASRRLIVQSLSGPSCVRVIITAACSGHAHWNPAENVQIRGELVEFDLSPSQEVDNSRLAKNEIACDFPLRRRQFAATAVERDGHGPFNIATISNIPLAAWLPTRDGYVSILQYRGVLSKRVVTRITEEFLGDRSGYTDDGQSLHEVPLIDMDGSGTMVWVEQQINVTTRRVIIVRIAEAAFGVRLAFMPDTDALESPKATVYENDEVPRDSALRGGTFSCRFVQSTENSAELVALKRWGEQGLSFPRHVVIRMPSEAANSKADNAKQRSDSRTPGVWTKAEAVFAVPPAPPSLGFELFGAPEEMWSWPVSGSVQIAGTDRAVALADDDFTLDEAHQVFGRQPIITADGHTGMRCQFSVDSDAEIWLRIAPAIRVLWREWWVGVVLLSSGIVCVVLLRNRF